MIKIDFEPFTSQKVQWATEEMTPASMYFVWKQGPILSWPAVHRMLLTTKEGKI